LLGAALLLAVAFAWSRERALTPQLSVTLSLASFIGGLAGYVLMMAVSRWWLPVVRYELVGREYIAGIISGLGGLLVFGPALWMTRDVSSDKARDEQAVASGERYSQSQP
jgi:hypothetical protein